MTHAFPLTRRGLGLVAATGLAAGASACAGLYDRETASPATRPEFQPRPTLSSLTQGNWMEQIRAQHQAITQAFARVRAVSAEDMYARNNNLLDLVKLLSAHSAAEEAVLYPGLVLTVGDAAAARELYMEQQASKVMLAEAMDLRGADADFLQRINSLEAALMAHVQDEEQNAYPRLMQTNSEGQNAKMSEAYREAFRDLFS